MSSRSVGPLTIAVALSVLSASPPPAPGYVDATPTDRAVPADRGGSSGEERLGTPTDLAPRLAVHDDEILSLVETRLDVTIRHGIAVCHLVQVFENNTGFVLEGTYRLPLPGGAEVNGFSVWDEEVKLTGELVERARAERVYQAEKERVMEQVRREEAVRDPGKLTRDSGKAVTIQVFPILRRGMKKIEVYYSLVLPARDGRVAYSFPLGLARTFRHVGLTRIEIDLADDLGVADLALPAGASRDDTSGRILCEARGVPEGDFEISWRPEATGVATAFAAHRPEGEDGYFVLRLAPETRGLEAIEEATRWLVLADLSGSIAHDKKRLLAEAVRQILRAVPHGDRFRAVGFGDSTIELGDGWMAAGETATVDRVLEGLAKLTPAGNPSVAPIFREALSDLPPGEPARVLLVSDGIFVEDEPAALARAIEETLPERARFDTVGLGYDDDEATLQALASAGRGEFVIAGDLRDREGVAVTNLGRLRPWSDFDRFRVEPYGVFRLPAGDLFDPRFLRAERAPLRDLAFELLDGPVTFHDVHAGWNGGLFPGECAFVFGRYSGSGPARARLTGKLGREAWSSEIAVDLPTLEPDNRMLASFWARRQVESIERRRAGSLLDSDRATIVELSKRHRIVTSQTAFLALTDEMRERHALGEAPPDDMGQFYTFSEGVPEPETVVLVGVAALVLLAAAIRRRRRVAVGAVV